jgi:CRISPR/Cas system CSM-associated protein Csm3 (group 7 of RAMP superfamily)
MEIYCSICNEKNNKCKCKEKKQVQNTCFVQNHNTNQFFAQPCNGSTQVIFEDFTDNHNKTLIEAASFNSAPCTAIIIIETRNRVTIERILPPLTQNALTEVSFQVEDLRRISIRCQGDPTGTCVVNVGIQKSFCICCPEDPNSHGC